MENNDLIENIKLGEVSEPRRVRIKLDDAKTNFLLSVSGSIFYVIDSSSLAANVNVKFNRIDVNPMNMVKGLGWIRPFNSTLISFDAQPGEWVDLFIADYKKDIFELLDKRSEVLQSTSLDAIQNQLEGDTVPENWGQKNISGSATKILSSNANRKSAIIHNPVNSGDVAVLGFDNTTGSSKYFISLQEGESWGTDDYRGEIWAYFLSGPSLSIHYNEV